MYFRKNDGGLLVQISDEEAGRMLADGSPCRAAVRQIHIFLTADEVAQRTAEEIASAAATRAENATRTQTATSARMKLQALGLTLEEIESLK